MNQGVKSAFVCDSGPVVSFPSLFRVMFCVVRDLCPICHGYEDYWYSSLHRHFYLWCFSNEVHPSRHFSCPNASSHTQIGCLDPSPTFPHSVLLFLQVHACQIFLRLLLFALLCNCPCFCLCCWICSLLLCMSILILLFVAPLLTTAIFLPLPLNSEKWKVPWSSEMLPELKLAMSFL